MTIDDFRVDLSDRDILVSCGTLVGALFFGGRTEPIDPNGFDDEPFKDDEKGPRFRMGNRCGADICIKFYY